MSRRRPPLARFSRRTSDPNHCPVCQYAFPPSPSPHLLPQVVQAQPAKPEEDKGTRPEDPFVLLGPPLDHAYGVAADAQRISDTVQPLLGVLQHLALCAQVAEDSLASVL